MGSLFHRLGLAGFAPDLLPIIPPNATLSPQTSVPPENRGKTPGVYNASDGTWHGFQHWREHTATETDLERWAKWSAASIGVKTGRTVGVDIDIADPSLAAACEAAAVRILGPAPCRIGQAPKRLLPYRIASPVGKRTVVVERPGGGDVQKVEILCDGQQFVAHGIHPKTGKPYTWRRGDLESVTLAGLTEITADKLTAYIEEATRLAEGAGYVVASKHSSSPAADRKPIGDPSLTGDVAKVTAALAALGNSTKDYGEWITRVCAVKAALGGKEEHYPIYEGWCLGWPGNTAEEVRKKWDSVTHSTVGAAYVFDCARREAGWTGAQYDFEVVDDWEELRRELLPAPKPDAKPVRKFNVRMVADIEPDLNKQWAIDDILPANGVAVLYAQPNEGKSFTALDMGMAIARGVPWHGRETIKGAVLYVATEGTQAGRVRAYIKHHKLEGQPIPCAVIEDGANLCDGKSGDTVAIAQAGNDLAAAMGEPLALIVIDTLAMAISGGDENSGQDMGAMLSNVRAIQRATGATVLIVHHEGKDSSRGMRGSSALAAAVDTTLKIKDRVIEVEKQRDGEIGARFAFKLERVELGTNARGKVISSCVAIPADASARRDFTPPPLKAGTANAAALAILESLIETEGTAPTALDASAGVFDAPPKVISLDRWRAALATGEFAKAKTGKAKTPKALGMAISRIRESLVPNYVAESGGYVWPRRSCV